MKTQLNFQTVLLLLLLLFLTHRHSKLCEYRMTDQLIMESFTQRGCAAWELTIIQQTEQANSIGMAGGQGLSSSNNVWLTFLTFE